MTRHQKIEESFSSLLLRKYIYLGIPQYKRMASAVVGSGGGHGVDKKIIHKPAKEGKAGTINHGGSE